MPIRICATRSVLLDVLKSDRNFSSNGVDPERHLEVFLSVFPASLALEVLGCVAATVFGMTTCTRSHSQASWFSWPLAVDFLVPCAGPVFVLIHSRISDRTDALYVSLSSQRTSKTLR
jgi:hypothetical protein